MDSPLFKFKRVRKNIIIDSPSPKRRSPSPKSDSDDSPLFKFKRVRKNRIIDSPSPKRRSPSPKRRSPSPKRRSPSPKRRSLSPKRRSLSPKKFIESNTITFSSKKKEFQSLSNFWMGDITVNGITYESGEHCFHGEKYRLLGENSDNQIRKKQLLEYSKLFRKPSKLKTGNEVKQAGGKKGLMLYDKEIKDWGYLCIDVQRKICKSKFDNYLEVKNDIKKSGNKILIHPAFRCAENKIKDRLWEGKAVVRDGKIIVIGGNMLGNLWMELRRNELGI